MTTSKYVWRFVDAAGEGIYRHADGGLDPRDVFNSVPYSHAFEYIQGRPTPPHDSERLYVAWRQGRDLSGFGSIEQAKRWFDDRADMKRFDAIGVQLQAYPVNDTSKFVNGDYQAVFQPIHPDKHATFKPSDLYAMSAKALATAANAQLSS